MNPNTTLEEKTLAYWNTSAAFHGKPSQTPELTTEKALSTCSALMQFLGPQRLLAIRAYHMQDAIVMGNVRKRSSKKAPQAKILETPYYTQQKQLAAV